MEQLVLRRMNGVFEFLGKCFFEDSLGNTEIRVFCEVVKDSEEDQKVKIYFVK